MRAPFAVQNGTIPAKALRRDNREANQPPKNCVGAATMVVRTCQDGSESPRQNKEDDHGSGRLQDGSWAAIPRYIAAASHHTC